jgi:metallo-beta-lactamase family protein
MTATLTFCGGTGSVTGANFLLETGSQKILVDCGLEQGGSFCENYNYADFPYNPKEVDALIITHAHIDHIGRIPKLVKDGFSGVIYSTPPTRDLAAIMLEDALGILAMEAKSCNRDPLYTKEDIERAFSLWRTEEYDAVWDIGDSRCVFKDAGHILGSAMVQLERSGKKIVFTGDLGNSPDPLLRDTVSIEGAHYLITESVYGDRNHEGKDARRDALKTHIEEARARSGVLLIPSFSMQRTQVLLSEINDLVEQGHIAPIDVYLDSPLAIKVLEVYKRYPTYYNEATQARLAHDDIFDFNHLALTPHTEESAKIPLAPSPKVIIAGSGMSHGGRVRAHEKHYLSDTQATLLFVGYQTVGSLGRRIKDGAKEVTIDGEKVKVKAHIAELSGYSAHKDMNALIDFVGEAAPTLVQVFVAMGEPKTSLFLTQRLRDFVGVNAVAPHEGAVFTLDW